MNSEYVNLKIKRDILREALDLAIMHGGTMTFITGVYASIALTEKSMQDWVSKRIVYN
jgi:hypothetical protein